MGLPSRVDGEQTLLNTSSSGYMNPLPCGEKVNDPGAPSVPRNLQTPPTYKGPTQKGVGTRSPSSTTIPTRKPLIRAHRHDTWAPKLERPPAERRGRTYSALLLRTFAPDGAHAPALEAWRLLKFRTFHPSHLRPVAFRPSQPTPNCARAASALPAMPNICPSALAR